MDRDKYISLYEKFLAGDCTAAEEETLLKYQDQFELKEHSWDNEIGNQSLIRNAIFNRLLKTIQPKKNFFFKYTIAASVTILLVLSGYYYQLHTHLNTAPNEKKKQGSYSRIIVKPGSDKATLNLADGSIIVLDNNNKDKSIINSNGINIKQGEKGQLICDHTPITNIHALPVLNKISTPPGGQYQIVLEDGTKAWLNAASSLTFPSFFSGSERNVSVTGEVYFEVAKDKSKRFTVNFNGNKVTVLGTHFNVMAYKEESKSKVTLLEGSVRLTNSAGNALLNPGTQALINSKNNTITIRKANTEEAIAWKNGYFMFENENIQSIMRKISRWYNIAVIYRGDMTGKEFSGTISRFENVSEALDMLELTGTIRFNLTERRIEVMP